MNSIRENQKNPIEEVRKFLAQNGWKKTIGKTVTIPVRLAMMHDEEPLHEEVMLSIADHDEEIQLEVDQSIILTAHRFPLKWIASDHFLLVFADTGKMMLHSHLKGQPEYLVFFTPLDNVEETSKLKTQGYISLGKRPPLNLKKMLNRLFRLSLWLWPIALAAQSNIQLMEFSPEIFRDANLFKGIVLNTSGNNSPELVTITLSHNGQTIATQHGTLPPGSQNLGDASITSDVFTRPYKDLLRLGLLPAGSYALCVSTATQAKAACKTYRHIVRPSALCVAQVYPSDGAELEGPSPHPTLVWSSGLFNIPSGQYRLKITDDAGSGNRKEVRHFSMPAYYQCQTLENAHLYPFTAPELRENHSYQWNVDLVVNGHLVCQSEVWEFAVTEDTLNSDLPINLAYIDLTGVDDLSQFFILGELKLYLPVRNNSEEATIRIFDDQEKPIKLRSETLRFSRQSPYQLYDLEANARLDHLKPYRVEITTPSGRVRLLITYVNPAFYQPKADNE